MRIQFGSVVACVLINPTIESFFYALTVHQIFVDILVLILLIVNNDNKNEIMNFRDYFNLSKKSFYKIPNGLLPIIANLLSIAKQKKSHAKKKKLKTLSNSEIWQNLSKKPPSAANRLAIEIIYQILHGIL